MKRILSVIFFLVTSACMMPPPDLPRQQLPRQELPSQERTEIQPSSPWYKSVFHKTDGNCWER
jgi:hypothetical protein